MREIVLYQKPDEEYVEIYDYWDKEKDIWRRTYKNGEVIFEVKLSDYLIIR